MEGIVPPLIVAIVCKITHATLWTDPEKMALAGIGSYDTTTGKSVTQPIRNIRESSTDLGHFASTSVMMQPASHMIFSGYT